MPVPMPMPMPMPMPVAVAAGAAVSGVLPWGDVGEVVVAVAADAECGRVQAAGASDEFGAPHRVAEAVDSAFGAAGMRAGVLDLRGGADWVRGDGFGGTRVPGGAFLVYGFGGICNPGDRFFVSGYIHNPDDGVFVSGYIHNSGGRLFVSGGIHNPDDRLFVSGAVRGRDERGCCRMRGVALQRRRECEAPRLGEVRERRDRLQTEPALGEGAGLVGETVGGEREPFDRVRAGGDETGAGEGAERRGHRGRGWRARGRMDRSPPGPRPAPESSWPDREPATRWRLRPRARGRRR